MTAIDGQVPICLYLTRAKPKIKQTQISAISVGLSSYLGISLLVRSIIKPVALFVVHGLPAKPVDKLTCMNSLS